jgi:hypothetical protein
MVFKIELADNRYKPHQITSLHLITGFAILGIGAFTLLLGNADWVKTVFHKPIVSSYFLGIFCLIYGLAVLVVCFFKNKWLKVLSNNKNVRKIHITISFIALSVFAISQWWLATGICTVVAIANLFALYYEQKITEALFVTIDEETILLPATARRKQLDWWEVERILLRHGTITIDCSNNFLYQWNIKNNTTDVATFERFCTEQIEKNRTKKEQNNW